MQSVDGSKIAFWIKTIRGGDEYILLYCPLNRNETKSFFSEYISLFSSLGKKEILREVINRESQ